MPFDLRNLRGIQRQCAVLDLLPLFLDHFGEFLDTDGGDEDLDPGLVEIVPAAEQVIGPQDRFQI